jgi:TATA-binding protein-associated factor Taf7
MEFKTPTTGIIPLTRRKYPIHIESLPLHHRIPKSLNNNMYKIADISEIILLGEAVDEKGEFYENIPLSNEYPVSHLLQHCRKEGL